MLNRILPGTLAMALVGLIGCADTADRAEAETHAGGDDPQQVWWDNMQTLCGNAYAGQPARYDEAMDQGWLDRDIVIHVRDCSPTEIQIPLHVGENRSRTWILTRTDDGIRLKHDHRYPDGTEEESTQYGGDTTGPGTEYRQSFPADDYSRELFLATNHPDGVHNVWIMEIHPGERFVYNLTRPNRDFAVEFDLTTTVDTPPPTWAAEPQPDADHDH